MKKDNKTLNKRRKVTVQEKKRRRKKDSVLTPFSVGGMQNNSVFLT